MKKLTKEQIADLYAFTRKHYVVYYDLQTELVDHLANSIEAQWQQNEDLPFETALQIEFKKFGVFGFTEIVEKRQGAMAKRYYKIVGNHLLQFAGSLKMVALLLFTALLAFIAVIIPYGTSIIFYSGLLIYSIVTIVIGIKAYKQRNAAQKNKEKVWLFEELLSTFGMSSGLFFVPFYFYYLPFNDLIETPFPSLFLSVLVACMTSICAAYFYIILIDIPRVAATYLKQVYPEYHLAS